MSKAKKKRIDELLLELGHFEDLKTAQGFILAGKIVVDEVVCAKPGTAVREDAKIFVRGVVLKYASRGGYKLEAALARFPVSAAGKIVLDAGASTGGFTDCLLQRGASKVFAIDTGYAQLAYRLRQDERVVSMERTKLKALEKLSPRPALATVDVSFTGLENVIPSIIRLLKPGGRIVALVKPQFQAKRSEVLKGGVVKDPLLHATVIGRVVAWGAEQGLRFGGLTASPLKGPAGNREFFIYWVIE